MKELETIVITFLLVSGALRGYGWLKSLQGGIYRQAKVLECRRASLKEAGLLSGYRSVYTVQLDTRKVTVLSCTPFRAARQKTGLMVGVYCFKDPSRPVVLAEPGPLLLAALLLMTAAVFYILMVLFE